ncbi:MAG: hypothetical protein WCJ58_01910 [bacterium]
MTKKLIFIFVSVITIISIGFYLFNKSNKPDRSLGNCNEEFIRKYNNSEGYEINYNSLYQAKIEASQLNQVTNLKIEANILQAIIPNLDKITVSDVIQIFNDNGFKISNDFKDYLYNFVLNPEKEQIISLYVKSDEYIGGDVLLITKKDIVTGFIYNPAFYSTPELLSENVYTFSKLKSEFQQQYGNAEITFKYVLFKNTTVEFYYGKGLAYYADTIIYFKPSDQISEESIKLIGLRYERNSQGNPCAKK